MKKISILISATLLLVACGEPENEKSVDDIIASGDLVEIRTKRTAMVNEQIILTEQLSLLDNKIEAVSYTHLTLPTILLV